MKRNDLFRIWGRVLTGYAPALSIEITRECPLRCPGCYAYDPGHLGDMGPLRTLADYKGQALIDGVLRLVRQYRPVHVSIVGGEPLVRFHELNELLPQLSAMGIEVLVVTSAVRPIPPEWRDIDNLHIAVSVDGLQPDHDVRRKPATYERILKHIEGAAIRVHCTITRQMTVHSDYFENFVDFWSNRPEVRKIWFSIFTPQIGDDDEEILPSSERTAVLDELVRLRQVYPKIQLPDWMAPAFLSSPESPDECIFARSTYNFTADLKSRITPCQIGGNPDCSQCGCSASVVLKAVGDQRLLGVVSLRSLYSISDRIGKTVAKVLGRQTEPVPPAPLPAGQAHE